jgi:hypothetical protein
MQQEGGESSITKTSPMNVKGGLFEGGTNKKGEGKREGCVG